VEVGAIDETFTGTAKIFVATGWISEVTVETYGVTAAIFMVTCVSIVRTSAPATRQRSLRQIAGRYLVTGARSLVIGGICTAIAGTCGMTGETCAVITAILVVTSPDHKAQKEWRLV